MYVILRTQINTGKQFTSKVYFQKHSADLYAQKMNRYSCKYIYRVIKVDLISILKEKGLI